MANDNEHKPHNIAIDVGSGFTKIISNAKGQPIEIAFPSLVAPYPKIDVFQVVKPEKVGVNDKQWIIGESCALATKEGERSDTLSPKWAGSEGWFALFYGGIAKTHLSGKMNIITGIPQALYGNQESREAIKKTLIGVHVLNYMDKEVTIDIVEVMIIPQASAASLGIAGNDESVLEQKIGVIDIGTYTTGFSVMNCGQFVSERCSGVEIGVSNLSKSLSDYIFNEFAQKPYASEIPNILMTKQINQRGKLTDISRNIAVLAERVSAQIITAIREIWGNGNDLRIFVVGGGAPFFLEAIQADFTHAETIDDNFFAVAKGMWLFLEAKMESA